MGIPVFGIVDSNTDPLQIDYPIPANDDSIKSINLIVGHIADLLLDLNSKKQAIEEKKDNPKEDSK